MTKSKKVQILCYSNKFRDRINTMARDGFFRSLVAGLAIVASPLGSLNAQSTRTPSNDDEAVVHWPRPDFVIPFNVDLTGQKPREIQLEFSRNRGLTWAFYSSGDIKTNQFLFKANEDGEYQFRLKTLDSQGRSFDNPGEPLRVIVDTTKPVAKLVVDIDSRGVMQAEFELADAAIDGTTIQLSYQTEELSHWQDIAFELSPGQTAVEWFGNGTWTIPNGTRQLVVRLTAKDKAGNPVEVTRMPQLPRSAALNSSLQLASGKARELGFPSRNGNAPSMGSGNAPSTGSGGAPPVGSGIPEVSSQSLPKVEVIGKRSTPLVNPLFSSQFVAAQQQLIEQQSKLIAHQQTANSLAVNGVRIQNEGSPPVAGTAAALSSSAAIFSARTSAAAPADLDRHVDVRPGKLPVRTIDDDELEQLKSQGSINLAAKRTERTAQSSVLKEDDAARTNNSGSVEMTPRVTRIPGQTSFQRDIKPLFSNSKAFCLDYNIDNDPDSPISSVELWGTSDQGQTWQPWGQDPDRASPLDIEVETEGLFGFRMVIVGANGLASNRPRNGDNADAWIHVDVEQPQANIVSALYGKGKESGALIIEYRAVDDFFPDRPITLSYSRSPDGPWTSIISGARNNGRYVWPMDPSLPPSIFLKIEAHDAAGNVGVNQLDLAIDVEGIAPRGRIQGFRPIK